MMNATLHLDTQRSVVQGPPAASSTQLNQPGYKVGGLCGVALCELGILKITGTRVNVAKISVADPNPDPYVFGPPGSGSISQRIRILHPSIIKQIQ